MPVLKRKHGSPFLLAADFFFGGCLSHNRAKGKGWPEVWENSEWRHMQNHCAWVKIKPIGEGPQVFVPVLDP